MSTLELNNLWMYLRGLALPMSDREWLAGKLLEPEAEDAETVRQKSYVKETLTRALKEADAARRGEVKLTSAEEFLGELEEEGLL